MSFFMSRRGQPWARIVRLSRLVQWIAFGGTRAFYVNAAGHAEQLSAALVKEADDSG